MDVFTNHAFGGNPLAVFPEAAGLNAQQMQTITRELNLSETVFVLPPESPDFPVKFAQLRVKIKVSHCGLSGKLTRIAFHRQSLRMSFSACLWIFTDANSPASAEA